MHELEMIMQTVNLCDNLHIKKTDTGKVELKSNLVWLPCDSRNLVYRAAEYMRETYNIKEGIEIELVKNIPVAAGLAGGSSDCAATLVGINNLFRLNVSQEELMKIGKSFGADVPYCILRGTALKIQYGTSAPKTDAVDTLIGGLAKSTQQFGKLGRTDDRFKELAKITKEHNGGYYETFNKWY